MDLKGRLDSTTDSVRQRLAMLTHIISMSYDDLLQSIDTANVMGAQVAGDHLGFQIVPKTDGNIFWKSTIRIECRKIRSGDDTAVSTRIMKLKQYLCVLNELRHMSLMQQPITASAVMSKIGMSMSTNSPRRESICSNDREECCICMEQLSDVMLSCAHAYCQRCINQWLSRYSRRFTSELTCPVCRARVPGEADAWVLAEAPDPQESQEEMMKVLMELADRSGKPS